MNVIDQWNTERSRKRYAPINTKAAIANERTGCGNTGHKISGWRPNGIAKTDQPRTGNGRVETPNEPNRVNATRRQKRDGQTRDLTHRSNANLKVAPSIGLGTAQSALSTVG